jgi:hypothetical protein
MKRVVLLGALTLAACGGSAAGPKLPRSWEPSASSIAGVSCAVGRREADRLRASVIRAVNDGRVPAELQESLTSKVNAVASWPSCREGRRRARELAAWLNST